MRLAALPDTLLRARSSDFGVSRQMVLVFLGAQNYYGNSKRRAAKAIKCVLFQVDNWTVSQF